MQKKKKKLYYTCIIIKPWLFFIRVTRQYYMFICQTVNSERFLEALFCTRSFRILLRFGSLNTLLTLPVEKDCVGKAKPRARGVKPVTLFY